MASSSRRAYLLAPLVYLAVILGLLFLQFSSGERFSRSVGVISISGSRVSPADGAAGGVRSVRIEFAGLSLAFSEETGVVIETPTRLAEVHPLDIVYGEREVRVLFAEGVELVVEDRTEEYVELHIRLSLGDLERTASRASIPFRLTADAQTTSDEPGAFVSVRAREDTYFLTTPTGSSIDPVNRKIFYSREHFGQAVRYAEASTDGRSVMNTHFADERLAISDAEIAALIDAFVDAAYAGWSGDRFLPAAGTWTRPDGSARFVESIATAYLAEAWRREEYPEAFGSVRAAASQHPNQLGLLSAPFLGNLESVRTAYDARDEERISTIERMIDARDVTLFRQPDLFRYVVDHAGEALFERLRELAAEVALPSVDVATAVGLLRNHAIDPLPSDKLATVTARFVPLVEQVVLPALVHAGEGFFIQTAPGQVDVGTTLVAGRILDVVGGEQDEARLVTIGRNLIRSCLELADEFGLMPSTLHIRAGEIDGHDGWLEPAEIYPLLVDNPNYPRELSLYPHGVPGAFVVSAVEIDIQSITTTEWRFRLAYPRLRTHYLLLHGVPAFDRMELFGQTWRDAPDFELYSKGRHYDVASQTLMVKYYDDSTEREMALFYR